jgi:uncharacterized protein YggE
MTKIQVSKIPTIEVMGTAVERQKPTSGDVMVLVSGVSQDRQEAWDLFGTRFQELRDKLGDLADVGNGLPAESEADVTKGLRTVRETTVSAEVKLSFKPARFGKIVSVLVAANLPYTAPKFKYDKQQQVSPELLKAAAADARVRATAIAAGVDSKLGRLVGMNVGAPDYKWFNRISNRAIMASNALGHDFVDEDKLETLDAIARVTVKYELIENAAQLVSA